MSLLDLPSDARREVVPPGSPWSGLVRQGEMIRIVDLGGLQAVDTLFYSAADSSERYSVQDTLLRQGAAFIDKGTELISNEGRVMLTVIGDTCGAHDTSVGCCSCESNGVRFGPEARYMHACRENFIMACTANGMGKRDIVPNLNFFMNVPITQAGELAILDGVSKPGDAIELRAEMDVICLISNCPQMNNPCNDFDPTPIEVVIWRPGR